MKYECFGQDRELVVVAGRGLTGETGVTGVSGGGGGGGRGTGRSS